MMIGQQGQSIQASGYATPTRPTNSAVEANLQRRPVWPALVVAGPEEIA